MGTLSWAQKLQSFSHYSSTTRDSSYSGEKLKLLVLVVGGSRVQEWKSPVQGPRAVPLKGIGMNRTQMAAYLLASARGPWDRWGVSLKSLRAKWCLEEMPCLSSDFTGRYIQVHTCRQCLGAQKQFQERMPYRMTKKNGIQALVRQQREVCSFIHRIIHSCKYSNAYDMPKTGRHKINKTWSLPLRIHGDQGPSDQLRVYGLSQTEGSAAGAQLGDAPKDDTEEERTCRDQLSYII